MINHFLAAVGRNLNYAGIHADRIFRAGLNAEPTEHADPQVNVEPDRILLDIWIRMFPRDNVDTVSWAGRFAHHAGHAAWGSVFSTGEAMATSVAGSEGATLLRILKGNSTLFNPAESQLPQDVFLHVAEEMATGQPKAFEYFEDIESFSKGEIARTH